MLTAIVLAAGLSRRMGEPNKLLLPFGGSTILQTTLENLLAARVGEVLVVVGFEAEKIKSAVADFPVQIIENQPFESGMTSSIQAGVAAASEETSGFLICPGDMPFLHTADFQRISEFFFDCFKKNQKAIVQPTFGGQGGHPVVFSKFYKNEILENQYPEGCKPVLKRNFENVQTLEMQSDSILKDIDSPEDYLGFQVR